jgi:hypothetical protein
VHEIFSPETNFTPQSGTWGLQGILRIPGRTGDFVFFVTFGSKQGRHTFDEGINYEGVLTWQSQPKQTLKDKQIQQLLHHDCDANSIYLLLRTKDGRPYTYLGRLKYLHHDSERERPVYFTWQILDWAIPDTVLQRMHLTLSGTPSSLRMAEPLLEISTDLSVSGILHEESPPERSQLKNNGLPTRQFQSTKSPDYAKRDAANRNLGRAGELLVIAHEKSRLLRAGRTRLAEMVEHTADVEGEGAGFDVRSFHLDGTPKFIEVKTTRGDERTEFYASRNEVHFSQKNPHTFYLYRVYDFDGSTGTATFYVIKGALDDGNFSLVPTMFRFTR